jgi:hypothetical protein
MRSDNDDCIVNTDRSTSTAKRTRLSAPRTLVCLAVRPLKLRALPTWSLRNMHPLDAELRHELKSLKVVRVFPPTSTNHLRASWQNRLLTRLDFLFSAYFSLCRVVFRYSTSQKCLPVVSPEKPLSPSDRSRRGLRFLQARPTQFLVRAGL